MLSIFRDNRRRVQNAFFDTGFWQILENDTLILEEKGERVTLNEVKITNIPISKEVDMAYLINLELEIPIFGNAPKTKTTEKALLLISESACYIYMFELKSSLQADDKNDISAIEKKFKDTIDRISVLLTTFLFDDKIEYPYFQEIDFQYKGIVFYNKDENLIREATAALQKKDLYKAFEAKKKVIEMKKDISGIHQVEVFFCKNPNFAESPNTLSIDFTTFFADEWEYNIFTYSDKSLPQVKG